MKIIALPDLHGRTQELGSMAAQLAAVDVVLLAGDLTTYGSMKEVTIVVEAVRQHNSHLLAVPGNMDSDRVVDYLAEEGLDIHCQNRLIDGVAFVGVGGALPFAGPFVFGEAELASILNEAAAGLDPTMPQVLICHQPPFETRIDRLPQGTHVGSQSVRTYIETRQPLICFTGHIHEAKGIDRIGRTQIINPGPLWKGGYAYAEVEGGQIKTLEIRQL